MKIAILNDMHFGVCKGEKRHREALQAFLWRVFFPYVKAAGDIDALVINGDLFDTRKSVAPQAMMDVLSFLEEASRTFRMTYVSLGNHDIAYNDRLDVNSIQPLIEDRFLVDGFPNVVVVSDILKLKDAYAYKGKDIYIIPWIVPSERQNFLEFVKGVSDSVLFTHMDIVGSKLTANVVMEDGFEPVSFGDNIVLNGHIHRKSDIGDRIHNLGAQYQMTWGDATDRKYFHVFDTESCELIAVENPYRLYYKDEIPDEPEGKFVLFSEDVDDSVVESLMEAGAEVKVLPRVKLMEDENTALDVDAVSGIREMIDTYVDVEYGEEAPLVKKVVNKIIDRVGL